MILWCTMTSSILPIITADTSLVSPATLYAGILAASIPGRVIYSQVSQYLTARHIMYPTTVSALVAMLANLGLGLFFILGWPQLSGFPHYFGFIAAAPVTVASQYIQLLILFLLGF